VLCYLHFDYSQLYQQLEANVSPTLGQQLPSINFSKFLCGKNVGPVLATRWAQISRLRVWAYVIPTSKITYGPTCESNVGPTNKQSLALRWPNQKLLRVRFLKFFLSCCTKTKHESTTQKQKHMKNIPYIWYALLLFMDSIQNYKHYFNLPSYKE